MEVPLVILTPCARPRDRLLRSVALPLVVVAAAAALSACKIRYRRDVEPPGTPPRYSVSVGGFMRYDGYDDVAGDLEVASREYAKPGSPVRVRLVGVIHVGDLDYYRTLQRELLDTADLVLFEGVKYEGIEAPDLSGAYEALGRIVGLGFQKEGIDYRAKNFVHCDITVKPGDALARTFDPAAMEQALSLVSGLASIKETLAPGDAGREVEDALKHHMVAVMSLQLDALGGGGGGDGAGGGDAAGNAGRALEKRLESEPSLPAPLRERAKEAAKALKKAGPLLPELPGMNDALMKEILDKRNAYVVAALAPRIEAAEREGRPFTIAVFYGAAHMPGIEKDIMAWGFRPVETVWLKAWRMNGAGGPIVAGRERHESGVAGGSATPAGSASPGRAPDRVGSKGGLRRRASL